MIKISEIVKKLLTILEKYLKYVFGRFLNKPLVVAPPRSLMKTKQNFLIFQEKNL